MTNDKLQNLLTASTAAVAVMRDMKAALARQGWPLFAHTLYLPTVRLEQALDAFATVTTTSDCNE
jgi:hypothetical protein